MTVISHSIITLLLLVMTSAGFAQPLFWDSFENNQSEQITITVYRSPTCQCCKRWIEHLEKHNFLVDDRIVMNTYDIKEGVGLPVQMASCHTAIVGDYVIEGHVPANDIKTLLRQQPTDIAGLSVPQMPHGTPGMETGLRYDDFNVISFTKQGKASIFRNYKHDTGGMYTSDLSPKEE